MTKDMLKTVYPLKFWVKSFNLPILTADLLVAVLLLDIVFLLQMVVALVMMFAASGSPMDVKWYRPPRIGLSKHKHTLKITRTVARSTTAQNYINNSYLLPEGSLFYSYCWAKYDSFKQQDAFKRHTISFLSRIQVWWLWVCSSNIV